MSSLPLRLALTAEAPSVRKARHAVCELAERLGFRSQALDDVRLAVTEACTNVVRHAYPAGNPGRMDLEAVTDSGSLVVVVRDRGAGIRPNHPNGASSDGLGLGLGLPLLVALSRTLEIEGGPGRGTVVRLTFELPAA